MNARRIAAMVVICGGILLGNVCGVLWPPAEQLEARNTTVTHTGPTSNTYCGVMGCYGNPPGQGVKGTGHGGGGGTIRISP